MLRALVKKALGCPTGNPRAWELSDLLGEKMPLREVVELAERLVASSTGGVDRILAERLRQVHEEGFDSAKDDTYVDGALARAAAAYAAPCEVYALSLLGGYQFAPLYPHTWSSGWDKRARLGLHKLAPDQNQMKANPELVDVRIRELEKAGALVAAEIDRLLRLKAQQEGDEGCATFGCS
jgi:hypothetical protein